MDIVMDNMIRIDFSSTDKWSRDKIIEDNTFTNPKFDENIAQGYSNYKTPKYIKTYQTTSGWGVALYRGWMRELMRFLTSADIEHELKDKRIIKAPMTIRFKKCLYPYQVKAVAAALEKDFGILCAPCGSGKTVMACNIIAQRKQPTIIIVHTKELLYQWIDRIGEYLGLAGDDIGIVGAGKNRLRPITVAMVQTCCRIADMHEITSCFGQVIVDECHHIPARTFFDVVSHFDCKYMLGLSATPYRRDKLDTIIYRCIGPVTAIVTHDDLKGSGQIVSAKLIMRKTEFDYDYRDSPDYGPMLDAIVENEGRNMLIAYDIAGEAKQGHLCFALSDRVAHCEKIVAMLDYMGIKAALLTGSLDKKTRAAVIINAVKGKIKAIVATSQLAGEGLDIPQIARLFIIYPLSCRGRLIQYVGRAMRRSVGKDNFAVYDYVDQVGVLMGQWKKRQKVYAELNCSLHMAFDR